MPTSLFKFGEKATLCSQNDTGMIMFYVTLDYDGTLGTLVSNPIIRNFKLEHDAFSERKILEVNEPHTPSKLDSNNLDEEFLDLLASLVGVRRAHLTCAARSEIEEVNSTPLTHHQD